MDNRKRKNQLKIYLDDEEKELFKHKMKLARSKNMTSFLVKCVAKKEIYYVDLKPFHDIHNLLSNMANNLNQIARRTNQTAIIYQEDIKELKENISFLSKKLLQIHSLLLARSVKSESE